MEVVRYKNVSVASAIRTSFSSETIREVLEGKYLIDELHGSKVSAIGVLKEGSLNDIKKLLEYQGFFYC